MAVPVVRVFFGFLPTNYSNEPEFMTKSPTTLQPTASVLYALSAMTQGKFRHLPIVDFDEKLVGVLSIKNFLNVLSGGIVSDLRAQG